MSIKYCELCERKVQPVKKKFSIPFCILTLGVFYMAYHVFLKRKNRCPICQGKQLSKYSPKEIELKNKQKAEKKERRREKIDKATNYVKDKVDN